MELAQTLRTCLGIPPYDNCIVPSKVNTASDAQGIWQVKCPNFTYEGTCKQFKDRSLIKSGTCANSSVTPAVPGSPVQCVNLMEPETNAKAAAAIIVAACNGKGFCADQWQGVTDRTPNNSRYYTQFTDIATEACDGTK